ncbi:MAG: hypothetical protein ACON4F_08155 [Candidatus Puniceispirillaceae bacterium]
MRALLMTGLSALAFLSFSAHALTLKSGQVLGGDGEVYDGASPEQAQNILNATKQTDIFGNQKTSGINGDNLFLVVEDEVIFVPLTEISGKSKEGIKTLITDYVVKALTANVTQAYANDPDGLTNAEVVADIAEDTANLSDSVGVQALAEQAAVLAEEDAKLAAEWVAANVNLATVDAANEAARQAAEQAFEAVAEEALEQIIENDPALMEHLENGGTVTCDSAVGCYAE